MATSPPSTPKSAASAGSSGWVLEAKGKDPGSLNISRDISTAANQSITVRPGTQFTMKPSGKFKVDKGAETAETAKWGDDLLVTVPGGGQILLKGFYNKSPNAPASKMVIEQKNGLLRKVEGRLGTEPSDSPNPSAQEDSGNAAGAFNGPKGSSSSSSSGRGGGVKDGQPYQEGNYKLSTEKVAKKGKKKSDEDEEEGSGGFFAWLTGGSSSSIGALGLLGLSGAKKKSETTVNVSVTSSSSDSSSSTTIPSVSTLVIGDDTGSSASDLITKTASQTVSGTLSTTLLTGQTVQVSADNGGTWTAATATTGGTTFTLSGVTLSGSNTLIAKVVNASLAEGGSLSTAYVLDTAVPTATLTTGTYANTANATVQSSETGTAYLVSSSVSVTDEASITSASGSLWNKVTISEADTDTLLSLSGLADGTYTLYTVDVAGNVSTASSNTFTVDATATGLSNEVTRLVLSADTGISLSDKITKQATQTINGTLSEAITSDETVYVSPDGGGNWYAASATTGSTSFSISSFILESGVNNSLMAMVVNSSNLSGAVYSTTYTLDTTAPTVSSAAISSASGSQNNTLNAGDVVTATATFSESVTVTTTSGTPYLSLNIGGTTVQAPYSSGSGSTTLNFSYTILSGQNDTGGISIDANSLSLNSGTIVDTAGNSATLIHTAVADNASYMVDTTAPTVSSVAITSAVGGMNNTLNADDVVTATATFSEAITVDTTSGTPYLSLNIGGTTVQAPYSSGSGSTTLNFSYTILSGQNDTGGISIDANSLSLNSGTIVDTAGNSATLTHTAVADNASYMVDTTFATGSRVTPSQNVSTFSGVNRLTVGSTSSTENDPTSFNSRDMTIQAWINTTTDSTAYQTIVAKPYAYMFFVRNGTLGYYDWGTDTEHDSGISVVNLGWVNVAMEFHEDTSTASNSYVKFFVSGLAMEQSYGSFTQLNWNSKLNIGGRDDMNTLATTQSFIGDIDSVRIWNMHLTAPQLMTAQGTDSSLANDSDLGTSAGLWGEFLFDTNFADSSGRSQTVTTLNSPARSASTTRPLATDNSINVTLDEAGTVYLVSSSVTVSDLASITDSDGALWNSQLVSANTSTSLALSGLSYGTYHLYSADLTGNFGLIQSNAAVITNPIAVTFETFDDNDLGWTLDTTTTIANGVVNATSAYTILSNDIALDVGSDYRLSFDYEQTVLNNGTIRVSNNVADGVGPYYYDVNYMSTTKGVFYTQFTATGNGICIAANNAPFNGTIDNLSIKKGSTLPVVIDLNRDGVLSYGNVVMDVNGDGLLDATHWAGAQDGVLVWDKYHDGQVHDNSQYAFAQYDTTSVAKGKAATDLSGLAEAFDSNHDGVFDAQDAQFADFTVWQDANQNGASDAGEVKALAEWGLAFFNLTSDGVARSPVEGVREAGRTTATATDGTQVLVADVSFDFSTLAVKDLAADPAANTLNLSLSDVLADPNHTLVVKGEHHQAVWNNSNAQVLIDQQLLENGRVL